MRFDVREDSSEKIRNLIEYFNGDKKDKRNTKYERAVKLEKMINIYENKELIAVRKVAAFGEVYPTSAQFIKQFADLQKYRDDESITYLADITKAIGDYYQELEKNGTKASSIELLGMEKDGYFDNYGKACVVINDYISFNESPFLKDFAKKEKVNEYDFWSYVRIVSELNSGLYEQFAIKYDENRRARKATTIERVNNLYNGITTGKTTNGEDFDEIEFFKNLPFYNAETA